MHYIRITKENIDKEHICCAMSGKNSIVKKEWLKQRFEEGLVFYRSAERGKCFIEYIPAENAWVPIDADGYIYINCLWVSGSMKGHGYSNDLLNECIRDAKEQEKKGVCILSSEGRKKEFLADPKYLKFKGFSVADTSDCGINLMYLPFDTDTEPSKFKECARHPKVEEEGFVLYYTDQCPFTCYWVPLPLHEAPSNRSMSFYLLLGASCSGSGKRTQYFFKGNSCYKQRSCTERSGTGDNVCAIQRWKVSDTGNTV